MTVIRRPPQGPAPLRRPIHTAVVAPAPVLDTETVDTYPGDIYPGTVYPGATVITTEDGTPVAPSPGVETPAGPITPPRRGGWASAGWLRSAWAGLLRHGATPGGGSGGNQADGSDAAYYWNAKSLFSAWSRTAWAGRRAPVPISGGLSINPDPNAGTVMIQAWWTDAGYLTLSRVARDGTQTPVRSYNPLQTIGKTRHNASTNPTAQVDLSGYAALAGSIARLTGLQTPYPTVTTGMRVTQTGDETDDLEVAFPERIIEGQTVRGFLLRSSSTPTTVQMSTQWANATGTSVGTTAATISDAARTQSYRQWSWCVATNTQPQSASYGTTKLIISGVPAGEVVDVTAVLLQTGSTLDGPFFDGTFATGAWTGRAGLSPSALAPVQYMIDGEAPLDEPFTYIIGNPNQPGYSITSQEVTLPSANALTSWITHPGNPAYPIKVWVESAPSLDRDIDQGVFNVIGRSSPIVKSSTVRRAATGSIAFITDGVSERDRLKDMMSDGQPLLIRAPAAYGYPGNWWIALGKVTEAKTSHAARTPLRRFSGDFTEVDPPVDYVSISSYGSKVTQAAIAAGVAAVAG